MSLFIMSNKKLHKVSSNKLGQLISRIEDGTISGKIAKDIFEKFPEANTYKNGENKKRQRGEMEKKGPVMMTS